MAKKNSRRRKNDDNNIRLMFIVGAGLILVGIAAILLLSNNQGSAGAPQANTLSTIPAEVNYQAPDLSLQNAVTGKNESLTDYRDKVVLVNNWATWCPPCKAEIPTLESYYETHAANGFMIVGIEAGEPQSDVSKFVQEHNMTYPVWFDLRTVALSAFKNQNLPSSYVIDRKGTIRLAWVGEISQAMLEKYVTPLLAEN
jgi:peroxiredoxin